jgi:flagellar hook-basal body complex protein FliE
MVPIAQVAMSLFGASLDTASSGGVPQASAGAADVSSLGGPAGLPPGTNGMSAPAPFADLLIEGVGQVDQLERQARSAVEGLISGKGVDVHEAMIAGQKAEMGFELVLSVRNKALAAYQQVLGMQF